MQDSSDQADGKKSSSREETGPKLKSIDLKKEKLEAKKRTEAIQAEAREKMNTPDMRSFLTSLNQQVANIVTMSGYNHNIISSSKKPQLSQREAPVANPSDEPQRGTNKRQQQDRTYTPQNPREQFPFMKCSNYNSLKLLKLEFPCLKNLFKDVSHTLHNAEFLVIRSTNLVDFHKAMKYGVWSSSDRNNNTLYQAFKECDKTRKEIYLFFTQVKSSKYMGVARMMTNVNSNKQFPYWKDPYFGLFNIEWVYIQSIEFKLFEHIRHNGIEVTSFRDGTRIPADLGRQMMAIFDAQSKELIKVLDNKRQKLQGPELEQTHAVINEAKGGKMIDTLSNYSMFIGPWWLIDHFETLDFIEEKDREQHMRNEINRKKDAKREDSIDLNYPKEVQPAPQRASPDDWWDDGQSSRPRPDRAQDGHRNGGRQQSDRRGDGFRGRGRRDRPQAY